MLYKEPFVLYLNISVAIILLFFALPSLLNRREELKVRLAFFMIFFIVIVTFLMNLLVLHAANFRLLYLVWILFFFSLNFGPAVYIYVKSLLGSKVSKAILFSQIPGITTISYGIFLAFSDSSVQQKAFLQILSQEHLFYEIINLLPLVFTLVYCAKAWLFIKKFKQTNKAAPHEPFSLKVAWAKEFILYIFANVFVFVILVLVLTNGFGVSTMDMDMIGIPVFMLFLYLLVAVRSMMMYKEFEHQFVMAKLENDKHMQAQRLEIAQDLAESLGAQFSSISSVLEGVRASSTHLDDTLKTKIDTLADFSETSVAELKNTLWVLNSGEIYRDDLRAKILNFLSSASDARQDTNFDFNFDVPDNICLSSQQAANLFRAIQEIVNNALKYANASTIKVEVQQEGHTLIIKIADNGRGFDYEKEKNKSFGLQNLKSRIAAIDGEIDLKTTSGIGTQYTIRTKL